MRENLDTLTKRSKPIKNNSVIQTGRFLRIFLGKNFSIIFLFPIFGNKNKYK